MYRKVIVPEVDCGVDLKKCNEALTDLEYLNGLLGHIVYDIDKCGKKTIQAALYHVFHEMTKTRNNLIGILKVPSYQPE